MKITRLGILLGVVASCISVGLQFEQPAEAVACGVRVYMTASGATGSDATNDTSVETSLETGTDLCITKGVNYYDLSTVAASVTASNYDVIYVQGQNNWYSADLNSFQDADFQVIEDFLTAGGGVVIGEWHAWNACAKGYSGAWGDFDDVMPFTIRASCSYGSGKNVRFFRWERPLSTDIDTGVSADFVFEPADFAGSLSFVDLKTGATPYYWATWHSTVASIPPASDPEAAGFTGGGGMAGWVPTGFSGRVFAFSTTNGSPELADTSSTNIFRRLLVNALGWSGSVGGAITPDSIQVEAVTGGSVSTPAFSPSKITGTITYTITSGTLLSGLSLNSSTGQITGTPTQSGTVNVTIQATGSGGGSAEAVVSFSVTGTSGSQPQASSPAAAPETTTTTSTSTSTPAAVTSLPAPRTIVVQLPSTGRSIPWQPAALLIFGALTIFVRKKLTA